MAAHTSQTLAVGYEFEIVQALSEATHAWRLNARC